METITLEKHKEIIQERDKHFNEILRESLALAIAETKRLMGFAIKQEEQPIGVDEASKFTGIEVKTIYNLASKGEIPFYKKGKLFFYKSELNRWIKSGRCKSTKALRKDKVETLLTK